ncbi:MAG TPA: site-specific integrase [Actinocrinis sp.]|nr:site-specific integrase [Actinocrinis sp.]
MSDVQHSPKRGPVPPGTRIPSWDLVILAPAGPHGDVRADTGDRAPAAGQLPGQLPLFPVDRDYTLVDRHRHADPGNPALIAARRIAERMAEQHGWVRDLRGEVDAALRIVLSDHAPGDTVRYSRIVPLDKHRANIGHTAEILLQLGVLDDDRAVGFEPWLQRKLVGLADGIAEDTAAWARRLHDGSERTPARNQHTVRRYLRTIHPLLTTWSTTYGALREVTRDDIRAAADALTGVARKRMLVALRSLFQFCKKEHRIFCDPTTRLRTGDAQGPPPRPLQPQTIQRAAAAATTPAQKLVLALAAIHAARPHAIRNLSLDDLDVPNRRITINGHNRPLDQLTCMLLIGYLDHRRERWPHTANRHVLLTERTAYTTQPASDYWLRHLIPQLPVPLNKIRMDRQLEEALACGPDALRLVAVFGIAENTAVRYADAARELLESELERQ